MTAELIAHLETADQPLGVSRGGAVSWPDEAEHAAAYRADPDGYALLALVPGVRPWQRARILLQVLGSSWSELDGQTRATLDRVVRVLVLGLPAAHVSTVLLALRRRRANHKHVTRAVVRLLTEHAQAEELIATRRQVLLDCFEHALGKATARGCVRALVEGRHDHLRRRLYRFVSDRTTAAERVLALYRPHRSESAAGSPVPPLLDLDLAGERPATVTVTNRGDLAATLVHLYRGGTAADLRAALDRYAERAAGRVPAYPGTLALVLDGSASMRGYGDREWAVQSQALALRMVLERRCGRLVVVPVAGKDGLPGGSTDLAGAVLDAVAAGPDLVAVVSDGYENVYPGDLARVAATLPRVGVRTPIVFCTAAFGHSDDLTLRRPAPGLPQRSFWHESDFAALVLWMLGHTSRPEAAGWRRAALLERLATVERGLSTKAGDAVLEGSTR
jgi:hypothetical protein